MGAHFELASAANDADAVTRAQTLLARANARHERRMAQLAGGGSLPRAPAVPSEPAEPAVPAEPAAPTMAPSPMAAGMAPSPMGMRATAMTTMAAAMAATAMEGE